MAKAFKARSRIGEPVPFEIDEETFHIQPGTPGSLLLDVFTKASDNDNPAEQIKAMDTLFSISIASEDLDRWKAYIADPANGVTMEVLMEIMEYIVEVQSGGRPTEAPQPSSLGSNPSGPGPVAVSP